MPGSLNDLPSGTVSQTVMKGGSTPTISGRSTVSGNIETQDQIEGSSMQLLRDFMGNMEKYVREMERIILDNVNTKSELKIAIKDAARVIREAKEGNLLEKIQKRHPAIHRSSKDMCFKCGQRCKAEENQTALIRTEIEKVCGGQNTGLQALIKMEWPEMAFSSVKVMAANPVENVNSNHLVLWLGPNPKENAPIIELAKKKFFNIDVALDEGRVINDQGIVEILGRSRNKAVTSTQQVIGFLVNGDALDEIKFLAEVKKEVKKSNNLKVGFVAVASVDVIKLRKYLEVAFHESELEVTLYVPPGKGKKAGIGREKESLYKSEEVIRVCSDKITYADMTKTLRDSILPDQMGVVVKGMKKTKENELLIITEKGGGAEKLKEEILSKTKDIQANVVSKNRPLILSNLDASVTQENVKDSIFRVLEEKNIQVNREELEIKNLQFGKRGLQSTEIWLPEEACIVLQNIGKVKVGWSVCDVRKKVKVDRCFNCLKIGHLGHKCRSKRDGGKRCLKCTKEGHLVQDCENEAYCNECKKAGHRPDNMSCSRFRSLVYKGC